MESPESRDELLRAVAEIADRIDALEPGAELGTWMIVYEVNHPAPSEDHEFGYTSIYYSAEDPRGWVQEGLLHAGIRAVAVGTASVTTDEEEGEE